MFKASTSGFERAEAFNIFDDRGGYELTHFLLKLLEMATQNSCFLSCVTLKVSARYGSH